MTIKLYCFGESGNAYKAALTLELSGLEWQPEFVDFFNGATRTAEFRAINPMGEVPVMIDGDITLSQSGVIQDYISSKSGKLGARSAAERRDILRWQFWDNHKLSGMAGVLRFNMNFIPEPKRNMGAIDFMAMRLKSAYRVLDGALAGRSWLASDQLTIADLSCCGYLFYTEPFGFERADWPNIDGWLTRIAQTPGFKLPYDLMPGSPADRA